jgi:PhnB protein
MTDTLPRCTPFLLFDGECAEAMTFYRDCIGGELTITKLADTPMRESFPESMHGRVINSHLAGAGVEFSATDWMARDFAPVRGNMSAISVTGADDDRLRAMFDALADGDNNSRLQPLHEMPFGLYGQFYDRYDVQWIFVAPAAGTP